MCRGRWPGVRAILPVLLLLGVTTSATSIPLEPGPSTLVWTGEVHLDEPTWVPADTVLVVEPGTRVLPARAPSTGETRPSPSIVVQGDLVALGTPERPIAFHVPVTSEGATPGPSVVDHALFAPALPGNRCALALATSQAHISNTTFTGATDGLCLAGPTPDQGRHDLHPAATSRQDTDPEPRGPVAPSLTPNPFVPPPAPRHEASDPRPQPLPSVPDSTITLESNHYENNRGTGLNLTRPTGSEDTGALAVLSVGDQAEGNGIGIRVGDPGVTLSLSNATIQGNHIGLMADGGRARLDHARFDENRKWDTYATSSPASIQWTGSELEPACAHVEGRASYGCERGSVGGVTVLTILLGLIYSLVFLLSEAGRYVLTRVWVWLRIYSRIPREELLDHETRQELLEIVRADPGIHLRAVEREIGGYGRTAYHLARLEREGFLKSRREGIYRRFYPIGFDPDKRGPRSRDEHVYDLITRVPGIHGAEIARRLDTSRQSVAYHVGKLLEDQRIEAREGDRIVHLFPRGHI